MKTRNQVEEKSRFGHLPFGAVISIVLPAEVASEFQLVGQIARARTPAFTAGPPENLSVSNAGMLSMRLAG
ncbi:hypothetical protein [Mesorhizobium sp.]|uniref:hypothetical protein n=1 Tax=Mesorhizobium sp. TaxID=1871066 RepID=UPI0025B97CB0|nr:hypothetical protein [Mesorhizobium sp.]